MTASPFLTTAEAAACGYVYFAQAGHTGMVKIGWTRKHPRARVKDLQTGCPHEIQLLSFVAGSQTDERALHERFDASRGVGEWFAWSPELAAHIDSIGWAA